MTLPILKIYNTGTSTYDSYNIYASSIQVSFKNNNTSKPNANGGSATTVQTQSFDNPMYSLQGVLINNDSGTLTYAKLLEAAKYRSATNPLLLLVNYGTDLVASDGTSTAIPVVVNSYNFPLTTDKSEGYNVGGVTITFMETVV